MRDAFLFETPSVLQAHTHCLFILEKGNMLVGFFLKDMSVCVVLKSTLHLL